MAPKKRRLVDYFDKKPAKTPAPSTKDGSPGTPLRPIDSSKLNAGSADVHASMRDSPHTECKALCSQMSIVWDYAQAAMLRSPVLCQVVKRESFQQMLRSSLSNNVETAEVQPRSLSCLARKGLHPPRDQNFRSFLAKALLRRAISSETCFEKAKQILWYYAASYKHVLDYMCISFSFPCRKVEERFAWLNGAKIRDLHQRTPQDKVFGLDYCKIL